MTKRFVFDQSNDEQKQVANGEQQTPKPTEGQIEKVDVRRAIPATKEGLQFQSLEDIYRFGKYVIDSGIFPQFKKPSEIVIVAQIAADTKIPLSQALQNICFINGRATMWGDALLAAAYATGMLEDFKEEIVGEGDDMTAVCTVKRKDIPTPFVRKFSMKDAQRAGLLDKRGEVWKKYPARMLQMRARSWALRDAGLTQGIVAREEVEDLPEIEVRPLPDTEGEKRKFGFSKPKELADGNTVEEVADERPEEDTTGLAETDESDGQAKQIEETEQQKDQLFEE